MNNTPDNFDVDAKKAKQIQTMRVIWIILLAVFTVIAVWHLYDWSRGRDNFRGALSPFGMIFLGIGALVRPKNRQLSYVFTGIAMILVFTGLILMFVY